jgi:3-hydroxyacyl-CoA dehydrogenase
VKPEAIFASNTSGFCIQDIARDVSDARKERFVGMHFSNPVSVMRMCEVVWTPQNSPEVIETARRLAEAAGKEVSMVKDTPGTYGFILNRVFAAAAREARAIVEAGIATREDVDRAMITGRNWPSGFFGGRGGIGKEW